MANYDIVKDYDWTSSPKGTSVRNKTPKVFATSYRLKSNQITQALRSFVSLASGASDSGNGNQFYDKLYKNATVQEDNFHFPYFEDNITSYTNEFSESFQGAFGRESDFRGYEDAKKIADKAALMAGSDIIKGFGDIFTEGQFTEGASTMLGGFLGAGAPGIYVETPKFYSFGSAKDTDLKVKFVLANTINRDSVQKNYDLVQKLMKINKPRRNTSISVDPPRIYKILLKGQRYIRWAYCSNLTIDMLGFKRMIGNIITPEAYSISMSFRSLTLEHAGFADKLSEQ